MRCPCGHSPPGAMMPANRFSRHRRSPLRDHVSEEVRRIIYTTNALESLNAKLRRAVRARGHFPTDESATKLLFLVLHHTARLENAAQRMRDGQSTVRDHVRRPLLRCGDQDESERQSG